MKKAIVFILLLTLLLTVSFGCKKARTEESFYLSASSYKLPTSSEKADLHGYSYHALLQRGCIAVSATEGEETLYGVIDAGANRLLFPAVYGKVEMEGDFFILPPAESAEETIYRVAYLDGTFLTETTAEPTVRDIGGGYATVTTGAYMRIFHKSGSEILSENILGNGYECTACENFILARHTINGDYQVFNILTGESVLSFYPPSNCIMNVYYAGGNDFIAVYDYDSTEEEEHSVALLLSEGNLVYLRQTITRMTVGVPTPHALQCEEYVFSLKNKYSFGMTEEEREAYSIKPEYFTLGFYSRTADGAADGTVLYALTDRDLKIKAELPNGIRPDNPVKDGYLISGKQASSVYLLDEHLKIVFSLTDANYQSVSYSDGMVVLAKIEDGRAKYGAFSTKGQLAIDFDYAYLSKFAGGKAAAVKAGKIYILDKEGRETYVAETEDVSAFYVWEGFYERPEYGRIGLSSYDGTSLVPANYATLEAVTRCGDAVYVAMRMENAVDVYILR